MIKKLLTAIFAIALGVVLIVCIRAQQQSRQPESIQLWAAVSVNQPLFQEGWTKDLLLHFTLVNDESKVVDAESLIGSSKIIVNGEELKDSSFIFGNGLRASDWNTLPPNGTVHFTKALERYFQKPGVYKVSWKSSGFETSPIVFRVMPRKSSGS